MIPVTQHELGLGGEVSITPENIHLLGDCVKSAIASILEREWADVPHFSAISLESGLWWAKHLNDWLEEEGYPFRYDEWYFTSTGAHRTGWYLGLVKSKTLTHSNHMVVMHDGEMMHDPSVNAGKPEYDAIPYEYIGVGYFYIPDPAHL